MGSTSMAFPAFVVAFSFFLLSHLSLHSAEEHSPQCPPFSCGNLNFSYPFSNSSPHLGNHFRCGLSTILCQREIPMLVAEDKTFYVVKDIDEVKKIIVIQDPLLIGTLQLRHCDTLYNFSISIFYTLSFKVKSPNVTLIKCEKNPISHHFLERLPAGFHEYKDCENSRLFYSNNSEQSLPRAPDGCSVFYFPLLPPLDGNWSNLLPLLENGFPLEWSYPPECHGCETSCRPDHWMGAPKCAFTKHGGKKLETILGIVFGALAGGILLLCLFFIYHRRCRNERLFGFVKNTNLSPSSQLCKNTFPNPSSTIDLEKRGSTYFGVHIFSFDELVEATNNFDTSRKLGDGGFGIVYNGTLWDGRVVAVKRLYENTFKRVEQFMNEVEILNRLSHQNLVTLYGCTSRHGRDLLLVYEYIPNGTVADHLHGHRARTVSLRWPIRMSIAIEAASALSYLHASDVIHRDVKTNNILLDNDFRVKVADFGLSRLFPLDVTHVSTAPQGTPGYVDPLYHQCYKLTDKSDVYSFGVVLIELISSMPAVDINRHQQEINLGNFAINMIQKGALHKLVDPSLGFESDYAVRMMITLVGELAFRCLQLDREMRPSMDEVLEVLRAIESEDYTGAKAGEVVVQADDVGLLKSFSPPLSPDSDKWVSRSTTPSG